MEVLKLLSGLILITIVYTYEIGTVNKYSYETKVVVNEKCGQQSESQQVGHQLKTEVHLTSIWESSEKRLIKIELLNPKLLISKKSSFADHASELDSLQTSPTYLLWEGGSAKKIWDHPTEHFSLRNLKRGVGSLLNFRKTSENAKETDVSGECDVIYEVKGSSVLRRKGNCVHPKFDKTLSQPNGVRSASIVQQSSSNCDWTEGNSPSISKCATDEYVKMLCNTWHRPSLCVEAKSELILVGSEKSTDIYKDKSFESVIEEIQKSSGMELVADSPASILEIKKEKPKKRQLKPAVAKHQDALSIENLPTLTSVLAFYKLLPLFRGATKGEILQLLNNDKLESIRNQIFDLLSACATDECVKAAFEYFEDEKEYNLSLERFVISLSILPKPSPFILKELKSFIEKHDDYNEKIEDSLIATLGALLKTYAENHEISDKELEEDIRLFLEDGLQKCPSDDETCSLSFLRSLRNAARFRSIPLLLEYALKGGKEATEAVLALKNMPQRMLTPECLSTLLKVFNQVGARQDRTTRALAAEIVLKQNPSSEVLKDIMVALSDQSDPEVSTFLAAKIEQEASFDEELRQKVNKVLSEKEVSYYYSLAQNGQSSVFRRPLLAIEGTNVSYGLDLEMIEGGLLKKSVIDVSFENVAGDSNLLTVGIFAEGLGAVAGDSFEEVEGVNPSAGMEVGVLGSSMRPYVFFRSTGELMGHVWAGTGSEETPVIQGILSLSDDEKVAVLSNGMAVSGQLRGVLSLDSSASVQISLWNRNAQSLVKFRGAVLVRGSATVDAGFVVTQGTTQFKGESGINFKSDIEFYELPFMVCVRAQHPDIEVLNDVTRSVSLPGTSFNLRRGKKRKINVPGRSLALHERNNAMCHAMADNL